MAYTFVSQSEHDFRQGNVVTMPCQVASFGTCKPGILANSHQITALGAVSASIGTTTVLRTQRKDSKSSQETLVKDNIGIPIIKFSSYIALSLHRKHFPLRRSS